MTARAPTTADPPHRPTSTTPPTHTEKFSIGKVFDEEGTFWEEGLARYVEAAVERFRRGQWDEDEGKSGGGGLRKKEGKKNK
jgi:hypothetical protein